MNRYETHQLHTGERTLSFDACQVQFILNARLPKAGWPDECTAASIAHAIARHIHRQTVVRYADDARRRESWHPLNPRLHRRLARFRDRSRGYTS